MQWLEMDLDWRFPCVFSENFPGLCQRVVPGIDAPLSAFHAYCSAGYLPDEKLIVRFVKREEQGIDKMEPVSPPACYGKAYIDFASCGEPDFFRVFGGDARVHVSVPLWFLQAAGLECFDSEVIVCVDADFARDLHGVARDGFRVEVGVAQKSSGSSQRIGAA